MTRDITENGIITLTPDEGRAITNGSAISDSTVYLGVHDAVDNWTDCDIPVEEVEGDITLDEYNDALQTVADYENQIKIPFDEEVTVDAES